MKLLELLIALSLSAILLLTVDTVYSGLWRTRALIHAEQENLLTRQMPEQLFSKLLFHAGHLGCRALREGIPIHAPPNIPDSFLLQQGQALAWVNQALDVHDTLTHQIQLKKSLNAGSVVQFPTLAQHSQWLLVSDCQSAELVQDGGHLMGSYQAPVFVAPVVLYRWTLKEDTLYRQSLYPVAPAQPVLNGVKSWRWERVGALMRLTWEVPPHVDVFVFQLGNA